MLGVYIVDRFFGNRFRHLFLSQENISRNREKQRLVNNEGDKS
jgi:hypothetical protein